MNKIGDLLKETTPDGVKNYSYDVGGRILNINYIGNDINYIYDSEKVLERITMSSTVGQYQEIFTNDAYKRLTSKQYTTPLGFSYTYTYSFDDLERLETEEKKVTGASGTDFVKTKNVFKNGYLWKIQDFATNTDLKVYDSFNERGQVTGLTFGNGLSCNLSYDQYGYLTQNTVNKNNAQFYTLTNTWDVERGNLTSRSNILHTFTYKGLQGICSTIVVQRKIFLNRLFSFTTNLLKFNFKIVQNSFIIVLCSMASI